MKTLLTFLTIILFSFGANGSPFNLNQDKQKCKNIGDLASESYFQFSYYLDKTYNAKTPERLDKYNNFSKDFLDRAYKLANIYNTFCKD